MQSGGGASEAARIASGLMNESSAIGVPAIRAVTDYASQGIDKGLPAYVERGYGAARTAAYEQSKMERLNSLPALKEGQSGTALGGAASQFAGSAGALARTQAGINLSRTQATLTNRNQLVKTLMGQGAQSTNLAAGFGALANRGLEAGLGRGDSTYEAITGGGALATTLFTKLLEQNKRGSADYSSPLAASYSLSQIPVL